ncbi:mitochondrial fission regulator 2 isoform X1 [Cyclopterus lumpus]|uniref:mitochondrial fission regulator 2 isoform X1 n=1 Tax=Cyclopterus lumpus TaxID=8103 RepID=UPI0014866219|nr:mitochondrial fission regulator 2 isoform X1 [Cyclopterus lumpus]
MKFLPMSLVEDFLEVLRTVLEYFGVPPDMLVPVWDTQLCGQYRSVVRMIGTNLSLTPTPRVHFQVPLLTYRPHGYDDLPAEARAIPSFADVLWVFEDEGESYAKTRNHIPPKKGNTVTRDVVRYPAPAQTKAPRGGRSADPVAMKKITALESELLKLRAQIAMIVTAAPASGVTESQSTPGTPLMSSTLLPALTSTPRCAAPPPPPPPPPLPPPPSCPGSSAETPSVFELIRKRRKNENDLDQAQLKPQDSQAKGSPSMLDVLRNLNQVKLRSVARSPGGTPIRRRRSKGGPALLSDPAALIAEALKRKFAQHRHNSSSDKENSLELSPFGSPDTPKVPLHVRRSQGRLHL